MGPCPNPAASEPLGHDPLGPELAGVVEHDASLRVLQVLVQPHPWPALTQDARQLAFRTSIGSRRRSVPFSSSRSVWFLWRAASNCEAHKDKYLGLISLAVIAIGIAATFFWVYRS